MVREEELTKEAVQAQVIPTPAAQSTLADKQPNSTETSTTSFVQELEDKMRILTKMLEKAKLKA